MEVLDENQELAKLHGIGKAISKAVSQGLPTAYYQNHHTSESTEAIEYDLKCEILDLI